MCGGVVNRDERAYQIPLARYWLRVFCVRQLHTNFTLHGVNEVNEVDEHRRFLVLLFSNFYISGYQPGHTVTASAVNNVLLCNEET